MEKMKETLRQKRICRLCLTDKENLSSIFDKTKNKRNAAVSLTLQIMNCFTIEVVPSDGRPSLICDTCRHFVEQTYAFKQLCREADERLMAFLQQGDDLEPVEWPQHLIVSYEALIKSKESPKKPELAIATPKVEGPEGEQETCKKCILLESELATLRKSQVLWPCEMCNRKFFSMAGLAVHSKVHGTHKCINCDQSFPKNCELQEHIKKEHKSKSLTCEECQMVLPDAQAVVVHERLHRKFRQSNIECCHCAERVLNRSKLNKHLEKAHASINPFPCEYCTEAFPTMHRLVRHLLSHSPNRPLPCRFCVKIFTKIGQYKKHVNVSHNYKKKSSGKTCYRCNQCNKEFSKQADLAFHMAVHSTENLQCHLCKENLPDLDALTLHVKAHAEDHQYMCDLCDLVFTSESKLEKHLHNTHKDQLNKEKSQDKMKYNGESGSNQVKETLKSMPIFDFGVNVNETPSVDPSKTVNIIKKAEEKRLNQVKENAKSMPSIDLGEIVNEPPAIDTTKTSNIIKKAEEAKLKLLQMKDMVVKRKGSHDAEDRRHQPPKKRLSGRATISDDANVAATEAKTTATPLKPAEKSLLLLEKDLHELKQSSKVKKAGPESEEEKSGTLTSTPKPLVKKKSALAAKTPSEKQPIEKNKTLTPQNKSDQVLDKSLNDKQKPTVSLSKDKSDEGKPDKSGNGKPIARPARSTTRKNYARMARANSTDTSEEEEEEYTVPTQKKKLEIPPKKKADAPLTPISTEKKGRGRPRKYPPKTQPDEISTPNAGDDTSTKESANKRTKTTVTEPAQNTPQADNVAPLAKNVTPVEKNVTPVEKIVTPLEKNVTPVESTPVLKLTPMESSDKSPGFEADMSKNTDELEKQKQKAVNATTPIGMQKLQPVVMSPKKGPNVIVTAEGKKLTQVPASMIKSLPPGVKPKPLPMPMNAQISMMKIGDKTVKVQKYVMTKAEVEAMAKKGLVEFKEGTMVLKQGFKLPVGAGNNTVKMLSNMTGDMKHFQVSPIKAEPPKPTRCPSPTEE